MSVSVQRMKNVAPLGMLKPLMVPTITVRFAVELPFSAPVAAVGCGALKSRPVTLVYAPEAMLDAVVLYSKLSLSGPAVVLSPDLHCSPV